MTCYTVATFNVRNARAFDGLDSWPLRRRATVATIQGLDADVVGVQEMFRRPLRYVLRRLGGYEAHGDGRDGGGRGERCSVLVRSERFEVVHQRTRWFGETPAVPATRLPGASFPRVATTLQLRDRSTGTTLDVWNTHLDERVAANRERSAWQLASWLRLDVPTVVLGDFNTDDRDDAVFAPLLGAGLTSALPPTSPGTAHAFTGRTDGPRIDHILVSGHLRVEAAEVVTTLPLGRMPSDHWPVRASVSLREA